MKKFICSLLCATCLFSCIPGASASNLLSDNNEKVIPLPVNELANLSVNDSIVLEDGAVLTKIPAEEYAKAKAESNDSIKSKAKIPEIGTETKSRYNRGQVSFYDYEKGFVLVEDEDGEVACGAEIHAKLKLYIENSYAEVQDVTLVYTRQTPGSWNTEYIESDATSDPVRGSSNFPVGKVYLFGDGYFKLDKTENRSISIEFLEGVNFTSSKTIPNMYYSETYHLNAIYKCY